MNTDNVFRFRPSPTAPEFLKAIDIDRTTPAYRRAMFAGFKITALRFQPAAIGWPDFYYIEGDFECVCGTQERYRRTLPAASEEEFFSVIAHDQHFTKKGWDLALELEHFGSFSAKHLLGEGYTQEQVKEIRYIYDLEDEAKRLRHDVKMLQLRLSQYEQVPLDVGL